MVDSLPVVLDKDYDKNIVYMCYCSFYVCDGRLVIAPDHIDITEFFSPEEMDKVKECKVKVITE